MGLLPRINGFRDIENLKVVVMIVCSNHMDEILLLHELMKLLEEMNWRVPDCFLDTGPPVSHLPEEVKNRIF